MAKAISKSKNPGLAKLAQKKPELAKKFGYNPNRMVAKKGGRVKKKKQGYKDRKDDSIAMRIKKKRTKKQLKASRDESYGKFGSKMKKKGKINR